MKKTKKEEPYFLGALLSTGLAGLVHYLTLSRFNFHPTIHVIFGIILFFFSAALISVLLKE